MGYDVCMEGKEIYGLFPLEFYLFPKFNAFQSYYYNDYENEY